MSTKLKLWHDGLCTFVLPGEKERRVGQNLLVWTHKPYLHQLSECFKPELNVLKFQASQSLYENKSSCVDSGERFS
jgi:hypothetical protein